MSVDAQPIRTVLVEDDPDVRYLVRALLDDHGRFTVVGEANSVPAAIALIDAVAPDLVVADLVIGSERLDALASFGAGGATVAVLSAHDASTMAERVIDAGAHAFFEKAGLARLPDQLVTLTETTVTRPT